MNPPSQGSSPRADPQAVVRGRKSSGSRRMPGSQPPPLVSPLTSSFTSINAAATDGGAVQPEQIYRLSQKSDKTHLRTFFPSIALPGPAPSSKLPSLSTSISPSCCLLFPPDGLKVNICRSAAALGHFKEQRLGCERSH